MEGYNAVEITQPLTEDERLFYSHDARRNGLAKKIRLNVWLPFDDKYWPGETNTEVSLGSGIQMLLLERSYDPDKGALVHTLVGLKSRLSPDTHPRKTRRFTGFMLISPGSALAALLVPASAENPLDF